MSGGEITYYPNERVRRILAFIPPGHFHAKFVIELCDQVVVLSEIAVAGLARAYFDIVTNPQKKAVELAAKRLKPSAR